MRKIRIGGFVGAMLIRASLLLAATSAMTGCAIGTFGTKAPAPTTPQSLREPCPETLPPAASSLFKDLAANHKAVAQIYFECRDKHAALIEATKDDEPAWWEFWRIVW